MHLHRARLRSEFRQKRGEMSPPKEEKNKDLSNQLGSKDREDEDAAGGQILAALHAPNDEPLHVANEDEHSSYHANEDDRSSYHSSLDAVDDDGQAYSGAATPERVGVLNAQTPEATIEELQLVSGITQSLAEQGREATERLLQAFDASLPVEDPPPLPLLPEQNVIISSESGALGPSQSFPFVETQVTPQQLVSSGTQLAPRQMGGTGLYSVTPLMFQNGVPVSPIQADYVTAQVEFWFSDENMSVDNYMRSLMDKEGWVFLCEILNFSRLQQMGVDLWALRLALMPSLQLELDGTAYYVRIRQQERRERWLSVSFPWYQ